MRVLLTSIIILAILSQAIPAYADLLHREEELYLPTGQIFTVKVNRITGKVTHFWLAEWKKCSSERSEMFTNIRKNQKAIKLNVLRRRYSDD